MRTDEIRPDSVREYFETKVFPEQTANRKAAKKIAEETKSLHNFAQTSGGLTRHEKREQQLKLETEPLISRWDCGCIYTYDPLDESLIISHCGTTDCLVERAMARIVE